MTLSGSTLLKNSRIDLTIDKNSSICPSIFSKLIISNLLPRPASGLLVRALYKNMRS